MTTTQPRDDSSAFFAEVFQSTVVPVRCLNCGVETFMNSRYAKHVTGGLKNCGKCNYGMGGCD